MGLIDRVEVENFKSFKNKQTIGPFKRFTAIIGPNGSGKSNLMDAISFVLGVSSRHLRGNILKDLIYKSEGEKAPRRRAMVKLVYIVDSGEVDDMEAGQEIAFMRVISPAGISSYRIDGINCTWEDYEKQLSTININISAKNFLVFQGDVESVASKTPKAFATMFEYISNSKEFEQEYEKLKLEMDTKSNDAIFNFQRKKGVLAEKKEVNIQYI